MTKRSVVVIGAGLAGSLLCNELANDADVTLLEIGEKDRIRYPKIVFDRKPLAHVHTFCYGGGGTTNLWHNGLIPIHPYDVQDDEFRQVLVESNAFVDEAAARLFFKGSYSRAYEGAVSEATAITHSAGIPVDGVDCLLYPKKFRSLTVDPRVRAFYGVDRINFHVAGRRITSVHFTIDGSEHSAEPAAVIVAAGSMGSPKILGDIIAASGNHATPAPPGVGLIDHPLGFVGKVRFKREVSGAIERLSQMDKGDYLVRSALRLKSECGRYTCCAFLRPALTMHNSLAIYKYKSYLGATAGLTRIRNVFSWKLLHPDIVAEVVSHIFGVNIPSRTFNVLFVAEQRRGSSRVYYDGDALRVDWSITAGELAIYRTLLRKLSAVLGTVAEDINIQTNVTDDWLWSGAHHSCTTSLGADATDLVDGNLKLKVCDNAYVCDASVIQEHSYANTGLTIGQLALRLAAQLRR
jgi:choline dehydrogenase-like flavoprotein